MSKTITLAACAAICDELARTLPATTSREQALKAAALGLNRVVNGKDKLPMRDSRLAQLPDHESWQRTVISMVGDQQDCQQKFKDFGERYQFSPNAA